MKWFRDGDQIVITNDDFVNLQESPVVFLNGGSGDAQTTGRTGKIISLPFGMLIRVKTMFDQGGGIL